MSLDNVELIRAVRERHSVRSYLDKPLGDDIVARLEDAIAQINNDGRLNIQLITDEPRAFRGIFAYGKFHDVRNYIVITGPKGDDLDQRAGYWGELLVLYAQLLGLNTCWVGLSYSKIPGTYTLNPGDKVVCFIALGYGATQGCAHRIKSVEQVSNASEDTPGWFRQGVEAALLAPSAINQQKYYFEYAGDDAVVARRRFSAVGYTRLDLGIAMRHFEIGADRPIKWQLK